MLYEKITLDKDRLIRYDFNAIADIEEYFGKGITQVFSQQQMGFRSIRALLWAGLKWQDRGLTMNRTGHMIQKHIEAGGNLDFILDKIMAGLDKSGVLKITKSDPEELITEPEQEDPEKK